ncbi:MAG: penicillin acylase family protein [Janthinobacterium lividum]
MTRILLFAALLGAVPSTAEPVDQARWRSEASRVTITRDDWGIAHVHGRSDADAVFGAIYAQAEDDFPRIEANYLTALGRTAEAEGEKAIWADLRERLFVDPDALRADYAASPPWLRALMDAWADGLNFYLATHPDVHPRVLTRFEPWMALSFTEGSIGGDVERVDLARLAAFYGTTAPRLALADDERLRDEPKGSNGIAIAPKLTKNGHALLLINPHTSFFFRSELGMESDAGLHAYGASTWGQFFLYQGWNEHLGWMHTSSGVDTVDEFANTAALTRTCCSYVYGGRTRPFLSRPVTLSYRLPDGTLATRTFTTWYDHRGPVVRTQGGKWVSVALMNRPIPALEQSWLRTRATTFAGYMKVAALQANSSNDTLLASREGTIAYLHPQFVPVRDDRLDWRAPVDGSDPAADWRGLTPLASLPQAVNPASGWAYNSNDAPWRAAGTNSPRQADFPRYMDQAGASPRGDHAVALLSRAHDLTAEGLRAIAYDPGQPGFDRQLPLLLAAFDALPPGPRRTALAEPIAMLRSWDRRWSAASEPTTLAMFWGETLWARAAPLAAPARVTPYDWMAGHMTPADRLDALDAALARLRAEWGGIHVAWGQVNRFQRIDDAITGVGAAPRFDDAAPSVPVPFTSAKWGSLASFGARAYPGTRRWYGTSGNSFVAVVEFGPRVTAVAVTAGGESGHPGAPHFADEAGRYAGGDLRRVYFYDDELPGHVERRYHPGG